MSQKVRHVLGISGGKDSAALAIYMKDNYPELDIEYYTADTGEELQETYDLVTRLEVYLGKPIIRLTHSKDTENHQLGPFELLYKSKFKYLPSTQSRWCTQYLKLRPFEMFIGNDPVVSYVGIRGDEEREGYISKKSNIQSIFPFRKNIWSEDVITKVLANDNIKQLLDTIGAGEVTVDDEFREIIAEPLSLRFSAKKKLDLLLNADTKAFNQLVFSYLKTTKYPLAQVNSFPVVADTKVSVKEDIFTLLRTSGVGIPKYYEELEFEVDGEKGTYSRSRSGCYFCFFQQKIEWVWLYEQHPELFEKAGKYEKEGYTWSERESLAELMKPERIEQIKREYIQKQKKRVEQSANSSPFLMDKFLDEDDQQGCAACFI
ncbi:phosphoadenosine phosphosulfate reductase family protein [Hymenobacter nivis]|uniref:Phosphoadenosine phosphosulfate reductase n=1 Tax=Hymenobacter nivis TaxID=1850093 RepID=A0A502GUH7_9BACT|nr:phosphoadenosine phosphosulfate reductase family protein [Hymenobacter nivis]TPG64626.1 phosphoadenosine phosphosulfate reductase [Hymenobacter nivis]